MIEVPVRFATRVGAARTADAVAVQRETLSMLVRRAHYCEVWNELSAFVDASGPTLVFGNFLEQLFEPPEILARYLRYHDEESVLLDQTVFPVPDFPADILLASRVRVDRDHYLIIGCDDRGGLLLQSIPRVAVRPLLEVLAFDVPVAEIGQCNDPDTLCRSQFRAGALPGQPSVGGGRPRSRRLVQREEQAPAADPAAAQLDIVPPAGGEGLGIGRPVVTSDEQLRGGGGLSDVEFSAVAADDPAAWWSLFLRHAGLAELVANAPAGSPAVDLRRLPEPPSPIALREAGICLVNALWRDRSRLDDLEHLAGRVPWVARRIGAADRVLQARSEAPGSPDPGRSLKLRWLCAWLGARRRFDFFWAADQRNRILADLDGQGLDVGRDLPELVAGLSMEVMERALGGELGLSDPLGLLRRLGTPVQHSAGGSDWEATRIRFTPGRLVEQPDPKPPLALKEISFPVSARDRNAVAQLTGALQVLGDTPGTEAVPALGAYFDFLSRAIIELADGRDSYDSVFFQFLRTELHGNLVRLANRTRHRRRVMQLLDDVRTRYAPVISDPFYRHQIELLAARVAFEAGGELSDLLAVIRRITDNAESCNVDTRDLLMECLSVLVALPAEEKLGVVAAMIGCVERPSTGYSWDCSDEVRYNLRAYLSTLHVDREGFLNTFRRWEGWRIRKVIEDDLERLRADEFVLGV